MDGNERIDFFKNATSLILGHANPAVVKAVRERAKLGTAFHAPTMHEVELARLLCERIPSVEKVRFMNSGTEAAMMAIRAAKAFTGKNKIGKMEGGYHGSADHAYVSVHPDLTQAGPAASPLSLSDSMGISACTMSEVVVMPFNDAEAVERIVRDELLNESHFHGLYHARQKLREWVADYNMTRPHSSLGYKTPAAYAAHLAATGDRLRNPDQLRRSPVAHTAPQGVNNAEALIAAG